MLTRDKNLRFLQKKIGEIKIAMFKAEIDPLLQLPNNIVSTLKTDDEGNIWFFTAYKGKFKKAIIHSFPACLEFYQKGGARIYTNGKADIIQDDTIPNSFNNNSVLIRFKIMHAKYFKTRSLTYSSVKTRVKDFFTTLFSSPNYREFDFPESIMQTT
jgi:general stress protein 26